jgi:hypothetical protein
MFKDFAEFKIASKLLADKVNQLSDFEAELLMTGKGDLDAEFFCESELFLFVVRTQLAKNSTKSILTLAFRQSDDVFPETYFKVCRFDDRRVLTFDELVQCMPAVLFKKVELEMPRFESTSNLHICPELQGYFKMNLCGLRDDYIQLTSHSKSNLTVDTNLVKDKSDSFVKMASWVSWVLTFFEHGLPSHILTN